MMPKMPKMDKELVLAGNHVFIIVGIVLVLIGLLVYVFTRKKEKKLFKYTGLGMMGFGLLALLNNLVQYLIFR